MPKFFPFDVEAFDNSERVKSLQKEYQKYWYLRLCVSAFLNTVRPGCVPEALCDLWKQAGVTARPPVGLTLNPMRLVELEFAQVLAFFVPTGDGWLRHERVSRDAERKSQVSNLRSIAARGGKANAQQMLNRGIDLDSSLISDIYKTYPRKKKPKEARRAIKKAIGSLVIANSVAWTDHEGRAYVTDIKCYEDAAAYLQKAVADYAASPEGKKPKQFVPYPASWFNGGSYLEDRSEWFTETQDGEKETDAQKRQRVIAAVVGSDADAD